MARRYCLKNWQRKRLTNIVVGIIGAFIGGIVFSALGLSTGGGLIGSLITAFIGAVVLLLAIKFLMLVIGLIMPKSGFRNVARKYC